MQKIEIFDKEQSIGVFLAIGVLIPVIYFLIFVTPANMDEFLPYHMLACNESLEVIEHNFRESCIRYPAKLFGIDFFKSYLYVGVSSSYLYYIFFNLFPTPLSHYILGLAVLVIFSVSLAKFMDLKLSVALVPALYFPLIFPLLHDIGPIRIALLAYPTIMYLVFKMFDTGPSNFKKTLLMGVMFFTVLVAVEDKPFFVYLIPQIFFIAYGYYFAVKYYANPQMRLQSYVNSFLLTRKTVACVVFSFFAILLALFVVLFCIRIPSGVDLSIPYFRNLASQVQPIGNSWTEIKYIFEYITTPIVFASRIYDLGWKDGFISAILFSPVLLIFATIRGRLSLFKYVYIASILILSAIFIYTRNTAYPHHFIFLHIPIVFLLMQYAAESSRKYLLIIALLALSTILSTIQLTYANVGDYAKFNRSDVFKYLQNEDEVKNSVINFSSWGGYYIQFLYGPRSQLIMDRPIDFSSGIALEEMRSRLNKDYIINVCYDCTEEGVSKGFPGKNVTRIGPQETKWILWKISHRP